MYTEQKIYIQQIRSINITFYRKILLLNLWFPRKAIYSLKFLVVLLELVKLFSASRKCSKMACSFSIYFEALRFQEIIKILNQMTVHLEFRPFAPGKKRFRQREALKTSPFCHAPCVIQQIGLGGSAFAPLVAGSLTRARSMRTVLISPRRPPDDYQVYWVIVSLPVALLKIYTKINMATRIE